MMSLCMDIVRGAEYIGKAPRALGHGAAKTIPHTEWPG